MSTLSHNLTQPHPGQTAADSLGDLRSASNGLVDFLESIGRKSLRWTLYLIVGLSLLVPVFVILVLVFRRVRIANRDIKKANVFLEERVNAAKQALEKGQSVYKALGFDELSSHDYMIMKQNQDVWLETEKKILALEKKMQKDLDQHDRQLLPKWRRSLLGLLADFALFVLRPFEKFGESYVVYNQLFAEMLRLFDESTRDGEYFKKISEDELWKKRTKVYEYII